MARGLEKILGEERLELEQSLPSALAQVDNFDVVGHFPDFDELVFFLKLFGRHVHFLASHIIASRIFIATLMTVS